MTPSEYEFHIHDYLKDLEPFLADFRVERQEVLSGTDGSYEIDVVARFEALGVDFLVLSECKHHKRRIERDAVQVLQARVQSMGAHKGILFSVSGFQSGAIKYARAHGVALIQLVPGTAPVASTRGQQTEAPSTTIGINFVSICR